MGKKEYDYWVYLMASKSRTLYCGVTSGLRVRVLQHRSGTFEGFSSSYKCHRLVWFQHFARVENAIAREKQIKRWRREKKIALIHVANPTWEDLSAKWF